MLVCKGPGNSRARLLEGGLVGALVLYGAPVVPATAAVLIYHTISFWIPSFGGAIGYVLVTVTGNTPLWRAAEARACEARTRPPQAARPASRPTQAESA